MGEACSTHGRDEKRVQNCGRKSLRENNKKSLGVDERIILE